jgi:uncharacterized cupredoxin-like copper-binding protein
MIRQTLIYGSAAALLLVACLALPRERTPEISITAAPGASFEAPNQVQAGMTTIRWENKGGDVHHAQLVRINDGVTLPQFQAAMQQGADAAFPLVTFVGGPGAVAPGGKGQVTLDLAAGQYLILDLLPGLDGVSHVAKGMSRLMTVTPREAAGHAAEPAADLTVPLKDFHIALPQTVKSGKQTWKIVNEGPLPHEMALIRLKDGKTLADVAAFNAHPSGEPPFEMAGGMQALQAGMAGWVTLDLPPGNYAALCFIPLAGSAQTHVNAGMVHPFTVQ